MSRAPGAAIVRAAVGRNALVHKRTAGVGR
jgi:hypothetical protein